jgi:integrase
MIYKRGNRYGVRIYVAKRQVWVGSFRTRQEARLAEREALMRVRPANDETVAEFVDRWLRDYKRPRASTNRHYDYMVKPLADEFGSVKMSDISRRRAREWALRHRGSVPVVRAMFNDALNEECVTTNPFANLRLDQRHGRRNLIPLTEAEVHELADTSLSLFGAYGPTFRACILFAAYVGLRPAEMFVLKWSDLDMAANKVHISRSLGSTGEITPPKNGLKRTVALPEPAKEVLLAMPRRADSPYVFTAPCGRRFSKTSHYYYWRLLRTEAGRPKMAFYELRHFCATHLLELDTNHADVAVQLGHTDGGALVMSTYGHPSIKASLARVLEAFRRNPARRLKAVGD